MSNSCATERAVWINAGRFFCGGVVVNGEKIITRAPPLLRWSKGKEIGVLIAWLERKGWLRSWGWTDSARPT